MTPTSNAATREDPLGGRPADSRSPGATARALQHMRAMVIDGRLSPGEQIRQDVMAAALGISRVPLREALNVMAAQGLLTHRPNAGYFVTKRSADERRQVRRMLDLLENETAASMAWPDDQGIAQLCALNQRMCEASAAQDWAELMQLNREFHFQIFSLSPDLLVLDELRRLWSLAEPLFAQKLAHPEAAAQTVREHEQLIDALRQQDREGYLARLQEHRDSGIPRQAAAAKAAGPDQLASAP